MTSRILQEIPGSFLNESERRLPKLQCNYPDLRMKRRLSVWIRGISPRPVLPAQQEQRASPCSESDGRTDRGFMQPPFYHEL